MSERCDGCLTARRSKLNGGRPLQRIVAVKLQQDWAPQQIAGWLKEKYPENPELWVSQSTLNSANVGVGTCTITSPKPAREFK